MVSVDSTSIHAVGYDEAARELYIEFVDSDHTYVYFGVGPRTCRELIEADSVGRYFNQKIHPCYAWRRL